MSLHYFIWKLRYRRKAKGRHGTHAPFVYHLVEEVLRRHPRSRLEPALLAYFEEERPVLLPRVPDNAALDSFDGTVLIVKDIHTDTDASEAWARACRHPRVTRSLDLLDYGVLLFSDAFKRKEHFLIK